MHTFLQRPSFVVIILSPMRADQGRHFPINLFWVGKHEFYSQPFLLVVVTVEMMLRPSFPSTLSRLWIVTASTGIILSLLGAHFHTNLTVGDQRDYRDRRAITTRISGGYELPTFYLFTF